MFPTTQGAGCERGAGGSPGVPFTSSARTGFDGAKPQQNLMSFFDTAGEDFREPGTPPPNARYLACADGILLLIDPLRWGRAPTRAPDTPLTRHGPRVPSPRGDPDPVTNVLLNQNKGGKEPSTSRRGRLHRRSTRCGTRSGRTARCIPRRRRAALRHCRQPRRPRGGPAPADSWDGSQIDRILSQHYPRPPVLRRLRARPKPFSRQRGRPERHPALPRRRPVAVAA